ncbi:MAG: ATPase [Prevotella sp.]|nr:ATPase [Prevotella sp.]
MERIDKEMILIADSGSTKTDWILAIKDFDSAEEGWKSVSLQTDGINPFHQTKIEILKLLGDSLIPKLHMALDMLNLEANIAEVAFYGAGCMEQTIPVMKSVLGDLFPTAAIVVENDLLGAARALLGEEKGVACILGTGANSCYYDGEKIVKNIPPLGYILGDEGSGAAMGKIFLNGLFKEKLPQSLREAFLAEYGMTYVDVIERIYRQPLANRFLASTTKFILRNIHEEGMEEIVRDNFRDFFQNNICAYTTLGERRISAVGSIAYYFKDYFINVAKAFGYEVDKIMVSPIGGMLHYHKYHSNLM